MSVKNLSYTLYTPRPGTSVPDKVVATTRSAGLPRRPTQRIPHLRDLKVGERHHLAFLVAPCLGGVGDDEGCLPRNVAQSVVCQAFRAEL